VAAQSGTMLRPLAVMMNRKIRTVSPDAALTEAAGLMRETRVGALMVFEQGSYVGVEGSTRRKHGFAP